MKAKMIYLAMLMMAMFAISACSSEEVLDINNDGNFPEISEGFKDNSVMVKKISTYIAENAELPHQKWEGYRSYYGCFHSLTELKDSPYASIIDELPDLDWEKQTLVVAYTYCNYIFKEDGCHVYSKSDKYTIDYKVCSLLGASFHSEGIAIVLNQPNVNKEDVNFKVSIAGIDYDY